ncbi:MAG: peptidoglycan DD-metalloendopeptidase family protein [Bacteroidia bacterium]|nr:peptidoglycan DD-metalloendopeptidase family protein [Bacteroidia bacterium]MBT8278528.1 peptidoglycan DD-metalloendopeptidase family protein [Bacteroidia bacterium]NNK61229.1 peptidoglycan DD-metalloendopeptidase family protein [Flavobacteriaceae bacterium]
MKNLSIIFLLISSLMSFGQAEDAAYDEAMDNFLIHFNEQQFDSIHDMFAESMKKAIPLAMLKMQMEGFYQMAGVIKDFSLLKDVEGGKVFKVDHEKNSWEYRIVLNTDNEIIGLRPQPYISPDVKIIERNTTKMILPFKEEWYVYWGGTEVAKNYHVAYENQKYAYDIMMIKEGSSLNGDPKNNESYYVFGKEVIAPCDAKVVQVIKGVHDNIPGELNPAQLTGNTVVLETDIKEYILFAHLKQGTITVEEGQMVKQGELLGKCGNSGNSTEPHLHLSLQNQKDMFSSTGGKLFFDKIYVNGLIKEDYLPEQGDKIKNTEN